MPYQQQLPWLRAIITVLNDFPDGLHYAEIASIIYERGYRDDDVPVTVNVYINQNGHIFEKIDTGRYRLRRITPPINKIFLNSLSRAIGNIEFVYTETPYSESNIYTFNSRSEQNPSVSLIGIIIPGENNWLYEAMYYASSQKDISNLIFIYHHTDDAEDIRNLVSWLNTESNRIKYFLVERQEDNSLTLTIAPEGWNLDSYLKSFRDQLKQTLVRQIPNLQEQDVEFLSNKTCALKISNIHYVCSVENDRLVTLSCLLDGDYRNQYSNFISSMMYRAIFDDRELKIDYDEVGNKSKFTVNILCDIRAEYRVRELIEEIDKLLNRRFRAILELWQVS